jgi:methionyl-tRNA formyltransferase
MKIIFFGTPDYVIPILDKLHKYHEIVAVVTQSPKPVGRDKIITYSAVDSWAFKKHIPRNFDYVDSPEADMGVCASFGMIIPKVVLDNFKFGILNIHPSLLPEFRGTSPIQATIIAGSDPAISIIKMDEKMDHGPILTQFKEDVLENDTNETLRKRLFEKSAEVLIEMIPAYIEGKIKLKPQDESKATYTKIIIKQDGFVDLIKDDPIIIERKHRAYIPWPGIWTLVNGKRLKILEFKNEPVTVQLEGKKPISYKQFVTSQFLTS